MSGPETWVANAAGPQRYSQQGKQLPRLGRRETQHSTMQLVTTASAVQGRAWQHAQMKADMAS